MKEFDSFVPDIEPADTDNPYGTFVDEGGGEAGTPLLSDFMNSVKALFEKLMDEAGLTYDDAVDTVTSCQSWDAFKALFVDLVANQTIGGTKTFSSIPVLPSSNPTTDNQAARKAYVDALIATAVLLTGNQTIGGTKTFSSIPVLPGSNPTSDNQAARKKYVDDLDDANVKLTGAQSIAGVKTFTDGINTGSATLKTKVISIGDWDMDSDPFVVVAHGLSEKDNIRSLDAVIFPDSDSGLDAVYPISRIDTSGVPSGGFSIIDDTNISLIRTTSGVFDSGNFDSTSFNRGYITVVYVV